MRIIVSILLFISIGATAQVYQTQNAPYQFTRGTKNDTILVAPRGCDTVALPSTKFGSNTIGAIYWDTCNNVLYAKGRYGWKSVATGSDIPNYIDSTGNTTNAVLFAINGRIHGSTRLTYDSANAILDVNGTSPAQGTGYKLRVNGGAYIGGTAKIINMSTTADTTLYKPVVIRKGAEDILYTMNSWPAGGSSIDTTSLSNRINLKLNISDTAAMLSPYLRDADTTGTGALYIRNTTTQEDKRFNVRAGRLDSLLASSSAGLNMYSSNGTQVLSMGGGGGSNATFSGGVNIDGTTRLATSLTGILKATIGTVSTATAGTDYAGVSNHNFFTTRQNFTSIVLNKDSIPITTTNQWIATVDTTNGRLQRRLLSTMGVTKIGTIQTTTNANGASISNDTLYLHAASATTGGVITTAQQDLAGKKLFAGGIATNAIENRSSGSNVAITAQQGSTETEGSIRLIGSNYTTSTAGRAIVSINGTFAQTSTSGNNRALLLQPVFNMTSSSTHDAIGIDYNPTVTSVLGQHYGMLIRSGRVGIGTATPAASAILDLSSTSQGFLLPRMTASQRTAISSPATGLQVFDTDTVSVMTYNGSRWVPVDKSDYVNNTLGSPVTMTTGGTFYTGATVVLPAGTWLLTGQIAFTVPGATGTHTIEGRIYNGSASVASGHQVVPASGNRPASMSLNTVVVITGNTTYTLDLTSNVNNGQINAVTVTSSQAASTQLTAVRLR